MTAKYDDPEFEASPKWQSVHIVQGQCEMIRILLAENNANYIVLSSLEKVEQGDQQRVTTVESE